MKRLSAWLALCLLWANRTITAWCVGGGDIAKLLLTNTAFNPSRVYVDVVVVCSMATAGAWVLALAVGPEIKVDSKQKYI